MTDAKRRQDDRCPKCDGPCEVTEYHEYGRTDYTYRSTAQQQLDNLRMGHSVEQEAARKAALERQERITELAHSLKAAQQKGLDFIYNSNAALSTKLRNAQQRIEELKRENAVLHGKWVRAEDRCPQCGMGMGIMVQIIHADTDPVLRAALEFELAWSALIMKCAFLTVPRVPKEYPQETQRFIEAHVKLCGALANAQRVKELKEKGE